MSSPFSFHTIRSLWSSMSVRAYARENDEISTQPIVTTVNIDDDVFLHEWQHTKRGTACALNA